MTDPGQPATDGHTETAGGLIAAVGSGVVDAVADEAALVFHLSASDRSSNAALRSVGRRVEKLTSMLASAGVAESDRGVTVTVNENGERKGTKWLTKDYAASARVSVTMRQLDSVGLVVGSAVRDVGAQVVGPRWHVSDSHPAHAQVWSKAAAEARSKAAAYADALGLELGAVYSVTDSQASPEPMVAVGSRMSAAAPMAAGMAEQEPDLDLTPTSHQIRALVTVRFRFSAPQG